MAGLLLGQLCAGAMTRKLLLGFPMQSRRMVTARLALIQKRQARSAWDCNTCWWDPTEARQESILSISRLSSIRHFHGASALHMYAHQLTDINTGTQSR
ncbi:hypothetical protein B0H67DRAFT_78350 [Lasiosphaeris hirsuta]|uniref:Uncharacterized protein n=1 Tax=Lasiosphaeris hirsuta TaxID=260670 RepID=A0AA40BC51_9PEZI|nr:hypothetical protein B0H67DRAFT_78350 [Lasiosphaeris hirsuta]